MTEMTEAHRAALDALAALLRNPEGCLDCAEGRLFSPDTSHEADCPYALAEAALAVPEAPERSLLAAVMSGMVIGALIPTLALIYVLWR